MAAKINMAARHSFLEATVVRRSTVDLKKESTIPDARIIELVKHSILHTPSAFHVQSARAVVLLGADHEKLWDLAYTASQKATPAELFNARFIPNLTAFKKAHGTVSLTTGDITMQRTDPHVYSQVLFFDDSEAVEKTPPMLGNLIKNFPEWGEHSNGMAQYIGNPLFLSLVI